MLTKLEEGFLMMGHLEGTVISVNGGPTKKFKVAQDADGTKTIESWEVLARVFEGLLGENDRLFIFKTETEAREVKPGYVYLF